MSRQAWKRAAAKAATVIAASSMAALTAGAASAQTGHGQHGYGHHGYGAMHSGPAPQFSYGGGYQPPHTQSYGAPYGLPPSALSAPIYTPGYGGFGMEYGPMFGYGDHHALGYGPYAPAEPQFAPAEPERGSRPQTASSSTMAEKDALESRRAPIMESEPSYIEVDPSYAEAEPASSYTTEIEPSAQSTYIGSSAEKDPYEVLLEAEAGKSSYSPEPYVAPAPTYQTATPTPQPYYTAPAQNRSGHAVQVAAFRDPARAERLAAKLRAAGEQAYVTQAVVRGTMYNRVRVAAGNKTEARMTRDRIHGLGYYEARMVRS